MGKLSKIAFQLVRKYYSFTKDLSDNVKGDVKEKSPVFILSMHRSGSSLLANMLAQCGLDHGPDTHLYSAKGKWKNMNPSGFYENWIFEDIGRFWLYKCDALGGSIPAKSKVKNLDWKDISREDLETFSLLTLDEDRLGLVRRLSLYRSWGPDNINKYLYSCFSGYPVIKSTNLSFFSELLLKRWPDAKFVVIFRNPDALKYSSERWFGNFDDTYYCSLYDHLLSDVDPNRVVFVSFDHLINDPGDTLVALSEFIPLEDELFGNALRKIDRSLIRSRIRKDEANIWTNALSKTYDSLLERAVNYSPDTHKSLVHN